MKKSKVLVIRNAQKAFISGDLKQPGAAKIIPKIASKVSKIREGDTVLILNEISNSKFYSRKMPKKFTSTVKNALMENSEGFKNDDTLLREIDSEFSRITIPVETPAFTKWEDVFAADMPENVEFTGTCLDSSIIADVSFLKSVFPEVNITIHLSACSAYTPEMKENAALILESLGCEIKRRSPNENEKNN